MTEGLWAAIIGVGGTILGTVLGFFLGKIDIGKLKVHIKKIKECPNYDHGEMYEYNEKILISLYNGSNRNRVFRNAKVILKDSNNTELLSIPLKDLATTRCTSYSIFTEDIGTINIQPKCGVDIDARFSIKKLETAYEANKVFLQYENEKFKAKIIELWECDYTKFAKLNEE